MRVFQVPVDWVKSPSRKVVKATGDMNDPGFVSALNEKIDRARRDDWFWGVGNHSVCWMADAAQPTEITSVGPGADHTDPLDRGVTIMFSRQFARKATQAECTQHGHTHDWTIKPQQVQTALVMAAARLKSQERVRKELRLDSDD